MCVCVRVGVGGCVWGVCVYDSVRGSTCGGGGCLCVGVCVCFLKVSISVAPELNS